MADPKASQPCKYCDRKAVHSLIWAEGRAYIPVCNAHDGTARRRLHQQGEGVDDLVSCAQQTIAYRESSNFRMHNALQPRPVYESDDQPVSFGLRAQGHLLDSALTEAPPVAPIGRASSPRGVTFRQRGKASKDIMRVSDKPIRKMGTGSKEIRKRSTGPIGYISKKEIPDNMLQMLGTDWKTLKATRLSDNRMTMSIDGVKYSLYTRRG